MVEVFCAGRNKQEELALLLAVLEIWHFFFLMFLLMMRMRN